MRVSFNFICFKIVKGIFQALGHFCRRFFSVT